MSDFERVFLKYSKEKNFLKYKIVGNLGFR